MFEYERFFLSDDGWLKHSGSHRNPFQLMRNCWQQATNIRHAWRCNLVWISKCYSLHLFRGKIIFDEYVFSQRPEISNNGKYNNTIQVISKYPVFYHKGDSFHEYPQYACLCMYIHNTYCMYIPVHTPYCTENCMYNTYIHTQTISRAGLLLSLLSYHIIARGWNGIIELQQSVWNKYIHTQRIRIMLFKKALTIYKTT